jgi:hypothetical protein
VEGIGVHFPQPGPAGELHQDPAGRLDVLTGEQAGPVAGQLGLAEPFFQAEDDRAQADVGDREPGEPGGEHDQDQQHRPVGRVPGQNVPYLMPDDRAQFLRVAQVDQAGVDHDERLLEADGHRVRERCLRDIHLWHLFEVQDVAPVAHHLVDVRELPLGHLNRAGQHGKPEGAFWEQAHQLLEHRVEAGELAQRHQGGPVRRVFVRA